MKFCLILLSILIFAGNIFAGNDLEVTLKGKVIDKSARESIAGVEIKNNDGKVIGYTDLDGYFEIKVNVKQVSELNFSYLSYKSVILPANAVSSGLSSIELEEN